ncbi:hypothetical protein K443DRAFT_280874 [Laccaria amethystina LaAM-08-1]|uniref:Uncharacterized protein n=1 Tax=Laccaria amethystina LaAM-08-1 TaxID=1095629 RepID=A0A0C9XKA0_9AGAR|nr:hypothetical protein K443DRAFT_280874 [Laccaria amethystina LaAM-08-1]
MAPYETLDQVHFDNSALILMNLTKIGGDPSLRVGELPNQAPSVHVELKDTCLSSRPVQRYVPKRRLRVLRQMVCMRRCPPFGYSGRCYE